MLRCPRLEGITDGEYFAHESRLAETFQSCRCGGLSLGFLLFLPGSVEGLSEDEKPLPGIDELLDKVRGNLRSDRYLLRN